MKLLLVRICFSMLIAGTMVAQTQPFYLIERSSVNFWENEDWGIWEGGRNPVPERIHMNKPSGWATFDIIYSDRDGYNRIKFSPGDIPGNGSDWYVEWKIDINPTSIGQGCMTEFQYGWSDDPEAHPDFQTAGWGSVDFCLGYIHSYISKLQTNPVWLAGSDIPGDKYTYYADATGWTGIPIIMRFRKSVRDLIFEAKKEDDEEFTEINRMPCAIDTKPGYNAWSLVTTGEWGAMPSSAKPWSGKAQYFRWYSNAEKPKYSVNFAVADSLDPFMVVPGSESPDHYSFTENPGWLRIHTEYAPESIMSSKNQLIQAFSPNLADDFYIITHFKMDPNEIGQAFGIKLMFIEGMETKEATCYFGYSDKTFIDMPGNLFFAGGLKGEEVVTNSESVSGPIWIRMARVGSVLDIAYSRTGGYRRLATLSDMTGTLINMMLAAGNFGRWGATEGTGSIPVDIASIEIEEKTVDVTPYYTMDNDFNDGLWPFEISEDQEDSNYYSMDARPGWYRIQTQYHTGSLDGANNVLKQIFSEPVTSGISVVTRVDMNPVEDGQVFGMQLDCQCNDGVNRKVILRYGKAPSSVTGGGYRKFFEYGYEGQSVFMDASSIGSVLLLRIERFVDRFIFSYAVGSETEYTILGSVSKAMGLITDVLLGAANLDDYGATDLTTSIPVDVDYFHYLLNLIADGQCEFTDGKMPWMWTLSNVDSTKFSLTERDGWLKVMTGLNTDATGVTRKGPNAIRAIFGAPHPGIAGDFDFTTLMEGTFSEPGHAFEINLDTGKNYILRYGFIGIDAAIPKLQVGVDSVQAELLLSEPESLMAFRILRQDSTIRFMYLTGGIGEWIQIAEVDSGVGINPVRYVNVAANNIQAYGASEATSSVSVYFDYVRFNRIDDFLTGVEKKYYEPEGFVLYQNYPNPFNPETTIQYQLPNWENVRLEIYNLLGQRVRKLVDKKQPAGKYTIQWDGSDCLGNRFASGVYIILLQAGNMRQTMKMILMK